MHVTSIFTQHFKLFSSKQFFLLDLHNHLQIGSTKIGIVVGILQHSSRSTIIPNTKTSSYKTDHLEQRDGSDSRAQRHTQSTE